MAFTVSQIVTYPVKSLRAQPVSEARVERRGMVGDRRWMVVSPAGDFLTFRDVPAMAGVEAEITPEGLRLTADEEVAEFETPSGAEFEVRIWRSRVLAQDAGNVAASFLTTALGRSARLVYMPDAVIRPADPEYSREGDQVSFADGFPLLLASGGSLDALNAQLEEPMDMRRFRPNLVVEGAEPWIEDTWRRIRVGEVVFRIVKPCERCIMTTRDPDTGERTGAGEPLRSLGKIHRAGSGKIMFGQNMIPENEGMIRMFDAVEVLETGPSNLLRMN
ncbi:MOSC domain protein [Aquimixticola soesokkakensis]|uniref:MOSC domain protein n=1 Tax=Aquimixticola soesokkakensis TaxID=1519096 RepID=A0A1Y5RGW2_9RHOB|nr:MOSC domain-containing protein [Aquimixticola soesokkakensis]SLN16887.1 MOSC domain protein [Aquimixticola soesokkakensis]